MPIDSAHIDSLARPSGQRRWKTSILIASLLGVFLTVVITWIGAVGGGVNRIRAMRNGGYGYHDESVFAMAQYEVKTLLGTRLQWTWRSDLGMDVPLTDQMRATRQHFLDRGVAPAWSRLRTWPFNNAGVSQPFQSAHKSVVRYEDGWGFPLRCLSVVYGWDDRRGLMAVAVAGSGIELPMAPHRTTTPIARALPLSPHWPGLTINSVFWGTVAWAAIWGWILLRDRRRRRRGWCIECGYDLRGQQRDETSSPRCPECGCAFGAASASV